MGNTVQMRKGELRGRGTVRMSTDEILALTRGKVVGTLVDSNVLLDVLSEDPRWLGWSSDALAAAAPDRLRLAGKCFLEYRGGARSLLPHFYIWAHAAVSGLTLLTRDASRYRAYFPRLALIAPRVQTPRLPWSGYAGG